jgi:hypothetical protein
MGNNLSTEKKVMAVAMLSKVNNIRPIERTTGVHRDTIKNDADERFAAVLETPPVDSPQSAVKVATEAEVKGKK